MSQRGTLRSFVLVSALAAFLATSGPAQSLDTAKEIQEIARKVDETLRDIDRLLLESSKRDQQRSSQRDKLQQARERSEIAEAGLDQLIEKLRQMQQQGGGGGSSSQQDQQQQESQDSQSDSSSQSQSPPQNGQGQGQRTRRENDNPEFVQQPRQPGEGQPGSPDGQQQGEQPGQQQPGQQPGQQSQGQQPGEQPGQQPGEQQQQQLGPDGKPLGGKESKDGGQNRVGNRGSEDPTGPGSPGTGDGSWGELQSYANFLKNRGSSPKVPEKYRKYWEAYLKQKQASGNSGR